MDSWREFLLISWQNHRGKLVGLLGGLLVGILILVFGFLKALFLTICALVGFFLGKRFDDKHSFRDILERFLPPQD